MPKENKHHVVSYSGGMGSFAEAKLCVDTFGKENVTLVFCDTLTEDEDLYRFIEETKEYLGCEFIRLSRELTIWELFAKQKFVANSRLDLCSRILKRDLLSKEFLPSKYGIVVEDTEGNKIKTLSCDVHVGIDFSEYHRLDRIQSYMNPKVYRSLCVERCLIIPKDYSEQFGIRKPRLYELGFGHNNCGGVCVKAGLGQFKMLYEKMPERYIYHEQKEQELIPLGTRPFLKKTINKEKRYLTMKQYREEFLEVDGAEEDKFDIGGCSCALPLPDDE